MRFLCAQHVGAKGMGWKENGEGTSVRSRNGIGFGSNGRKRDWVGNLNEEKCEVLLFVSLFFLYHPKRFLWKRKACPTSLEDTHWGMV